MKIDRRDLVVLAAGMVPNSADGEAIRALEDAKLKAAEGESDIQREQAAEKVEQLKQHEGTEILNLAYRFRKQSLEQGDVSWSWPLSQSWNFVGRYNFSFRDDEVLEQFYGLEYESCCWGLRLVSRRHISKRDGTRDSSFGLQLVLKGMSSVGTKADRLLERGILGYSPTL